MPEDRKTLRLANTDGGRLLRGKDNGKIAGVRSDEEQYMIEAAAQNVLSAGSELTMQTFQAEGRSVLVVQIEESLQNPYMPRMKQENRWLICASRMRIYSPHRFICVYGSKVVVRGEN